MKKRLTPRLISEKRGDSYEDQISISFSIMKQPDDSCNYYGRMSMFSFGQFA